jgi:hypothetical protein
VASAAAHMPISRRVGRRAGYAGAPPPGLAAPQRQERGRPALRHPHGRRRVRRRAPLGGAGVGDAGSPAPLAQPAQTRHPPVPRAEPRGHSHAAQQLPHQCRVKLRLGVAVPPLASHGGGGRANAGRSTTLPPPHPAPAVAAPLVQSMQSLLSAVCENFIIST